MRTESKERRRRQQPLPHQKLFDFPPIEASRSFKVSDISTIALDNTKAIGFKRAVLKGRMFSKQPVSQGNVVCDGLRNQNGPETVIESRRASTATPAALAQALTRSLQKSSTENIHQEFSDIIATLPTTPSEPMDPSISQREKHGSADRTDNSISQKSSMSGGKVHFSGSGLAFDDSLVASSDRDRESRDRDRESRDRDRENNSNGNNDRENNSTNSNNDSGGNREGNRGGDRSGDRDRDRERSQLDSLDSMSADSRRSRHSRASTASAPLLPSALWGADITGVRGGKKLSMQTIYHSHTILLPPTHSLPTHTHPHTITSSLSRIE